MEELDLKELFEIFWSRKIYILLITFIFMFVGLIYSYIFVQPKYKSETSLLIVKQVTTSSDTLTTSDLTLNQKLVSTYSELIKSKTVLREVINNLQMKISEGALKSSITVSSVKDTELIKISVVNENARDAKIIANEIVTVFTKKVKEFYKIDNVDVNVVDEAELEQSPYNINHLKDLVIFTFMGIIISTVYALVANMLDTTVKGKDVLEKKLGLSLLTEIPLCNFNETKIVKKGVRK